MRKNVNEYFKHHKSMVAVWVIVTMVLSFLAPLKAFTLQWIIDSSSKRQAIAYLGLGAVVVAASYVFESLSRRMYTAMACRAETNVRNAVVRCALFRDMEQRGGGEDSSYISLLSNDIRTLYDDYYMSIFQIVFWGGILLCALLMYFYINPLYLIVVGALSVPPLTVPKLLNNKLKAARDHYSEELARYTKHLGELLAGFETIRNFIRETIYLGFHEEASAGNQEKEEAFQQRMNFMITTTSFISNLTFIIILIFGMFLVFDGRITMGHMVTASSLANFVISPCQFISQSYAKIRATRGIRERFEQNMNLEPIETADLETVDNIHEIRYRNVDFSYTGRAEKTLRSVNFKISGREKDAIIGKSGSGKSTFVKLLRQYYPDYQGEILINGVELRKLKRESLYRSIGYISQNTFLFNDSIRNNICLYQPFTDAQVAEAVEKAGMREFVESLPEGVDTVIGENGSDLSGGQRQRIAIARLIIRNYQVIIADEITASLDPETAEKVMEHLLALDCMVLAITHDTGGRFMDQFDRIYVIRNGELGLEKDYGME